MVLLPPGFPARLTKLREKKHMSKAALARAAKLTWRQIHELEKGNRQQIQEETKYSLILALGPESEDLFTYETEDSPLFSIDDLTSQPKMRIRWWIILLSGIFGILAVYHLVVDRQNIADDYRVEGNEVIGFVQNTGERKWIQGFNSEISAHAWAPWKGGRKVIVLGLGAGGGDSGQLLYIDIAKGDTLSLIQPLTKGMIDYYGPDLATRSGFRVMELDFADLDGDEDEELVARYMQRTHLPSGIRLFDIDGKERGHYYNWGYLYDMLCEDLDNDGKDEIASVGTNNLPSYNGATVVILDEDNCTGCATDLALPHSMDLVDGSFMRWVFPQFSPVVMKALELFRLDAVSLVVSQSPDGVMVLNVIIGAKVPIINVICDNNGKPMRALPTDHLVDMYERWCELGSDPFGMDLGEYLDLWLGNAIQFEGQESKTFN